MKNLLLLLGLTFCLGFTALTEKITDVKADILKLEQDNNTAKIAGDNAAMNRLYADDFVGVNAAGGKSIKKDILSFYAEDGSVIEIHSTDQTEIRIFDKTALVTARLKYKYNTRMENQNIRWMRYSRVYVFRANQWQIVAEHFVFLDDEGN